MTFTWKDAAEVAKQLQIKYQLPIFAMTYKGTCSCCATPAELNDEAYLTDDIKYKPWNEIDSYIIFKNAHNCGGEADMDYKFTVVYDDIFGKMEKTQYIQYRLSEDFSKEKLEKCLTEFVDAVNKETFATYKLSVPEDTGRCATIEKKYKEKLC